MSALPGVRVGPLDPDSTSEFGQVAAQNSARTLVRLHAQMYPPQLRRALNRPMAEGHTRAVQEFLDTAVLDHLKGLQHDNGDPLLPEECRLVGAAVRGDRATGHVLTFEYVVPSGRTRKWFTAYTPEALPEVHELGTQYERVHQLRSQGLVAFDQEATGQEIYRRQLAQANEEIRRLRAHIETGEGDPEAIPSASNEVKSASAVTDELEQLRQENQDLRRRVAEIDSLSAAQGGGMPTAGLEEELAGGQPAAPAAPTAAQDPPFEGYDQVKADELCKRLRSAETSDEERERILEYERSHANRKSVVAAGEESLGSGS